MMTTTTTKISNRKLLIPVLICNPNNISNAKNYNAIIDTGSEETLISQKIINELRLEKTSNFVITTDAYGKDFKSYRHECYMLIVGHQKTFQMICGVLNRKNIDLIIGMDIIELLEINIKNSLMIININ